MVFTLNTVKLLRLITRRQKTRNLIGGIAHSTVVKYAAVKAGGLIINKQKYEARLATFGYLIWVVRTV